MSRHMMHLWPFKSFNTNRNIQGKSVHYRKKIGMETVHCKTQIITKQKSADILHKVPLYNQELETKMLFHNNHYVR